MGKSRYRVFRMDMTIYCSDAPNELVNLKEWLKCHCKKWAFQKEATRGKQIPHWQMKISLKQKAFTHTILESLMALGYKKSAITVRPSVTGNKRFDYVIKANSRLAGPWTSEPLENFLPIRTLVKEKFYLWQTLVYTICMGIADDRTVWHVLDSIGAKGKSQLVKFLLVHHPKEVGVLSCTGNAAQLISSVIAMGPKKTYIIDIPRSVGRNDNLDAYDERVAELMYAIEQIKNGVLVSCFYGKDKRLVMNHPNVVVFTNYSIFGLSMDRLSTINLDTETTESLQEKLDKFKFAQQRLNKERANEMSETNEESGLKEESNVQRDLRDDKSGSDYNPALLAEMEKNMSVKEKIAFVRDQLGIVTELAEEKEKERKLIEDENPFIESMIKDDDDVSF